MGNESFLQRALAEAWVARRNGAPIHPPAAAAHAAVESGYGRSGLAINGRNLFGTKARGIHTPFWQGDFVEMPTWEVIDGKRVDIIAQFRAYPTWAASFGDYGDIIRRVYPKSAAASCAPGFLAGLFLTGPLQWATDPLAYDKSARVLGMYADILCQTDEAPGPYDSELGWLKTVVLHDFSLWDRLTMLFPVRKESGVRESVIRGDVAFRIRGDKIDLHRRAR